MSKRRLETATQTKRRKTNLDVLCEASAQQRYFESGRVYEAVERMKAAEMRRYLDEERFGSRVVVSRRRKQGSTGTTVGSNAGRSGTQGRPFSGRMVVDLVIPQDLDELCVMLTSKGVPAAHRVVLDTTKKKPDKTFSNSYDMVNHFTNARAGFSVVTAVRQSSRQRGAGHSGSCKVVKFSVTPVDDYSVRFLKELAYPRYKAEMKLYIVPHRIAKTMEYYTSMALYLQDQVARVESGIGFDMEARIVGSAGKAARGLVVRVGEGDSNFRSCSAENRLSCDEITPPSSISTPSSSNSTPPSGNSTPLPGNSTPESASPVAGNDCTKPTNTGQRAGSVDPNIDPATYPATRTSSLSSITSLDTTASRASLDSFCSLDSLATASAKTSLHYILN